MKSSVTYGDETSKSNIYLESKHAYGNGFSFLGPAKCSIRKNRNYAIRKQYYEFGFILHKIYTVATGTVPCKE